MAIRLGKGILMLKSLTGKDPNLSIKVNLNKQPFKVEYNDEKGNRVVLDSRQTILFDGQRHYRERSKVVFIKNEAGKEVKKITTKEKIYVERVKKSDRKFCIPFGDVKCPPTVQDKLCVMPDLPTTKEIINGKTKKQEPTLESIVETLNKQKSQLKCRNCGESGHFTMDCLKVKVEPKVEVKANVWVPSWKRKQLVEEKVKAKMTTVKISDLPNDVEQSELKNMILQYAEPKSIILPRNKETHEFLGMAYVIFDDEDTAKYVAEQMSRKIYDRSVIQTKLTETREKQQTFAPKPTKFKEKSFIKHW